MDPMTVGFMLDETVNLFVQYVIKAYPLGVSLGYAKQLLYERYHLNWYTLTDWQKARIAGVCWDQ